MISAVLLEEFSKFVAKHIGLNFPKERRRDLERGVLSTAKELAFQEPESFLRQALSLSLPKSQIEILASNLTIGETYFFRENKVFSALEEHILPELLRASGKRGKYLRVWSAGCCTGEEPYSLAITLRRAIPNLNDWHITILATDINARFLKQATQATYNEWSFREAPTWLKERYLTKVRNGRYELAHQIRKMVTFSHLNLAEDIYPSLENNTNAMDIIFCRNVLMYFTPEQAKNVIQKLYNSLVDGGWLIVSSIETSPSLYSQFTTVSFQRSTVYRKVLSAPTKLPTPDLAALPELKIGKLELKSAPGEPAPVVAFAPELPPLPEDKEKKPLGKRPASYEDALALYEEGRYAEVAETLSGLLAKSEPDSRASSLLARAYANQGKLVEALEWCRQALAGDKLNTGLYYLEATILQEQGSRQAAAAALKRALYLDPNFVLAHLALANLSLMQEKPKQADKHFENTLLLLQDYPKEAIVPESEGMTAGRLMDIVMSTRYAERQL